MCGNELSCSVSLCVCVRIQVLLFKLCALKYLHKLVYKYFIQILLNFNTLVTGTTYYRWKFKIQRNLTCYVLCLNLYYLLVAHKIHKIHRKL